jgi:hypothetical protein
VYCVYSLVPVLASGFPSGISLRYSNRELIYTIASTPGFNVERFEYAAQYEFLSKRTTLLDSGTTAVVPSTSLNDVATTVMGAEDSGGLEAWAPATESPLGNKAANRSKRARESLEGSEVVHLSDSLASSCRSQMRATLGSQKKI